MDSKNTINELNNSLSYIMSQGSMELFHTNFWAGLIRKYPIFAEAFIGADYTLLKLEDEDKGVAREYKLSNPQKAGNNDSDETEDYGNGKKSIDILFKLSDGKAIVFENKFKSIPTKKQLCMYYDLLPLKEGLTFYRGILCTPFPTDIVEERNVILGGNRSNYSYIDYSQILDGLERIANENKNLLSAFDYDLLNNYCEDTRNVLDILDKKIKEDKNQNKYRIYSDPVMEKIGLNDICSKLSGQSFMSYFRERCKKENRELYDRLYLNVDFSNKKVILDFRFDTRTISDNKTNNRYFLIGIQIEGNQYRRVYEQRKPQKDPEKTVYDVAKNHNWFGEKKNGGLIAWDEEYKTGMRGAYCKYSGKYSDDVNTQDIDGKERKYMFIYQWKYLMGGIKYENKSIEYKDLYNQLIKDLILANDNYNMIFKEDAY